MSHRVKNAFAVANAVVTLERPLCQTPESMAEAIRGRLEALGLAHELTLRDPDADGTKADRPRAAGPGPGDPGALCRRGGDARWRGSPSPGPMCGEGPLRDEPRPSPARARDECGQARGALVAERPSRRGLACRSGVASPLVAGAGRAAPSTASRASEGFGSRLALSTARSQLGGEITHDWRPDGLVVNLAVPLDRLTPSVIASAFRRNRARCEAPHASDRLHPDLAPIRLAQPLAERVRGGPTRTSASVACPVQTRTSRPSRAATTIQPLATSRGWEELSVGFVRRHW